MKRFSSVTVAFAFALLMSGCATHPAQPSRPLGQPFELHAGTSAIVDDRLRVMFERVRSDSRCPLDALCIQAGEAIVVLKLLQPAAAQVEQELRTTPGFSETSFDSYLIRLVALAPYPRSTSQIRPEEYIATLTVDRR